MKPEYWMPESHITQRQPHFEVCELGKLPAMFPILSWYLLSLGLVVWVLAA